MKPYKFSHLDFTIVLLFTLIVVFRFHGIPDQYASVTNFYNSPGSYPFDIYMNNTFFFDSSLFYDLNKFLQLELSDVRSLSAHILASFVGAFFLFRLLKDHFRISDTSIGLLIILYIGFLGRDIPVNSWSGVISLQPGTATMLARPMGIATIYFLANSRLWWASLLVTATIAVHVLGDFILFPILLFFIALNPRRRLPDFFPLVLPVTFLIYKVFDSNLGLGASSGNDPLYEIVMTYGGQDSDFLAQAPLAIILLVLSFIILPFMLHPNTSMTEPLRRTVWSVYLSSALLILGAVLYSGLIEEFVKIKILMMLAPVRAMKFYTLLFYLTALSTLATSNKLNGWEKACAMTALILLHGENFRGVLYPVTLVFVGFAPRMVKWDRVSTMISRQDLSTATLLILVAVVIIQFYRGGVYFDNYSRLGWKYLNRWTVSIDTSPDVWHAFGRLGEIKQDFPLLPIFVDGHGKLKSSTYLNIVAKKSLFVELGHHFFFNLKYLNEHLKRKEMKRQIFAALAAQKPFGDELVDDLRMCGGGIMVPAGLAASQNAYHAKQSIGKYELLLFGKPP